MAPAIYLTLTLTRHPWDTADPFGTDSMANWYRGDYVNEQFRYYKARRRLVMSLGYKVNRTRP